MDLYILKYPLRRILEPLANRMIKFDPDHLGYLATFISLMTGTLFIFSSKHPYLLLVIIILILLRMVLNTLDGVIAIAQDKKDIRGEIVNALPDRYSDVFLFIGIFLSGLCDQFIAILGLATIFLVSYTGMLGKAIGVEWQHHGPLGKVERLIMVMISCFLQFVIALLNIFPSVQIFTITLALFVVLGQLTVFQRLQGMLKEIKLKEGGKSMKNVAVVYDSMSGNTEKIAREIARGIGCPCYYKTTSLPHPLNSYDLVIFGTPNLRAKACDTITGMFKEGIYPRSFAIFTTFGLPVWGPVSSISLIRGLKKLWKKSKIRYLGDFMCPGYHKKFKTYVGRPSAKDKENAFLFGKRMRERLEDPGVISRFKDICTAFVIKTLGRLSKGINMSFKYGFTSGIMLDYVYQNKPEGKLVIGKWIDKQYLQNPGWQGIRRRKENLMTHLNLAVLENRKKGKKSVVLDIASGPARYMIEAIKELGGNDISVVCQDIDERWAKEGQKIAGLEGLNNIRFQAGDAFDLSKITPEPNIIVSSGFYDWITDEETIKRSVNLVYKKLQKGGKFITTNQCGHLSLDLVKRTFLDFDKNPLIMKTWPLETMNEWLEDAGFTRLVNSMDKWGLYSVTTGEKR
ncbi:MAG: class I SAM-dependent methyltransferase family protein [Candidatus Margulisiibacteriota bacterium]